jgi:hypothetical protein
LEIEKIKMTIINYTLLDNFELKGLWWLPEQEDSKIYGILSFKNEDKLLLNLFGAFHDKNHFDRDLLQPDIIIGIADNGKLCTLFQNFEIFLRGMPFESKSSTFQSRYLFIGKHFNSKDSILFSSIQANYTNLENWMWQIPFKTKHSKKTTTVSYSFPKKFEAKLPGAMGKIQSTFNFSASGDHLRKLEWSHTTFLKIIPKSVQSFEFYWRQLNEINNLLTLLIGERIYLKQIKAHGDDIEIRPGEKVKEIIEIFFPQEKPNLKENIHPLDMIIPYRKLLDNISLVFTKWFRNADTLRSVYNLFFGTFYNPTMYLEFQFLSLIQALESYHRIVMGGKYLTDEAWSSYKDIMTNCIPIEIDADHKKSLKSRIKYGNEYSFRKRMKDLTSLLEENTLQAISPSSNYFIVIIVDTRHYYTHYDEDIRNSCLKGQELYYANQRLKILIIILLLKKIGLNEKIIIQSLRDCRRFINILGHPLSSSG